MAMERNSEFLATLHDLFPSYSESYLSQLLEQKNNDISTVIDILTDQNQTYELSLQLAEIFPDEPVEDLVEFVEQNESCSLQELIDIFYSKQTQHCQNKPASWTQRTKSKPIYKASVQDFHELEYNFTNSVPNDNFYYEPKMSVPTPVSTESILTLQLDEGTDPKHYKSLATHYYDCMSRNFQNAQKTFKKRSSYGPGTASYYSGEGYNYQKLMQQASRKAALCVFLEKNPGWPANVSSIDLHNLTVDQAIQIATEILEYKSRNVTFITGKGNHSHGPCKLKPALIQLGQRLALRVEILEGAVRLYS